MTGPIFYDLHIHSCLSPCGDDAMTPNNIVNMAYLKGLKVIALTDHNSCGNCRAVAQVAAQRGIGFLPGMELTTSEEIHVICLFPQVELAEEFGRFVYERLQPVENRPAIFGNQIYCSPMDEAVGTEPRLLVGATNIPITQVQRLCHLYGGYAYPAHIDKDANSVLAILGLFPDDCSFDCFEVADASRFLSRPDAPVIQKDRMMIRSSDAHYLWEISEAQHRFEEGDNTLCQLVLQALETVRSQ